MHPCQQVLVKGAGNLLFTFLYNLLRVVCNAGEPTVLHFVRQPH